MRWVAILLVGGAFWLAYGRQALAAINAGGGAMPNVAPISQPEIVALVQEINKTQFAGWFNPADVLAIIEIESAFAPNTYRAEPQIGDASRGLMQLLYSSAKDRGYQGAADGLFEPATNIALGMAHLKWSFNYLQNAKGRPPSVQEWISSYNAGVGYVARGGVRLAYFNRWIAARNKWAGALGQ